MINFLAIIIFLYVVSGIITITGYFPTIRDLLKGKESANIHSYLIWTLCDSIAFVYVLIVITDLPLIIITSLHLLACTIILLLTIKLRYENAKKK